MISNKKLTNIFRLDKKIVIVTGAAGLLGREHVEAIAAYGGTPILLDLSAKAVDKLAIEINQKYKVGAVGFGVDITNEEKVKKCSLQITEKFKKIDGLVNNAANNPKVENSNGTNFSRLENFPLEIWNQDVAVGLTGVFLCAKYFGSVISQNPNGGSIVNISSDLGLIAPDQRLYYRPGELDHHQPVKPITYSVIKTGIIGLTRYLATYWNSQNVRCNALCPGGVQNSQPEDFLHKVSIRVPMGRLADKNEYQGTLLWMLSDASSYLNGAVIPVDGGRTAW